MTAQTTLEIPVTGMHCAACVGRVQHAVEHLVGSGLVHLDEIGTLLVLRADHFDDLFGVIGAVGVREHVLGGVEVVGVLVAAENVDRIA